MSIKKTHEHVRGGIREMLMIAFPMIVSQACDTTMIFTDRLFLSRLSPELMNASLGGGLTSFVMITFFIGLIGYSTALVAQYLGAGRKSLCGVVTTQAIILSFATYPFILACGPLAHRVFEYIRIEPAQLGPQIVFFNILLFGSILSLLRTALSCFFSGIGRTRVVMISSLVAMGVNVVLNYMLIFGKCGFPSLGIVGAACGTIIGSTSGLAVLAIAYFSRHNRETFGVTASCRFDRQVAGRLLRYGSPAGCEMFLNLLAFNTLVLTFHSCGLVTATAATVMFNYDLVSFVPLIGVEIGVTSLVGRAMGAGDPETAHRSTMAGLKLALVYSLFVLVGFLGFPQWLVTIFSPDATNAVFAEAVPHAVFMIRVASLYLLSDAMLIAFVGALRGAGDTVWAMVITVALHWMVMLEALVIIKVFGLSPDAAWAAVVVTFLVFSFVMYGRYHSGAWKKIRIVAEPQQNIEQFHEQTS